MLEGIEDEHRSLRLLGRRELRGGIVEALYVASFTGCQSVLVDLQQHGGQVRVGDVVVLDEGVGQPHREELVRCLPVESSHLGAAAVDHHEQLVAVDLVLVGGRPDLLAKVEEVAHGELEGGQE